MIKAIKIFVISKILSLNSFSMVIVFYLMSIYPKGISNDWLTLLNFIILLAVVVLFSWLSLAMAKKWITTNDTVNIKRIKPLESTAMPTYIGLFVISLELASFDYIIAVEILFILFVLWIYFERVFYFNPMWIFFGYRFYEIESEQGNSFTFITKRTDMKNKIDIDLENLKRINNFTFLEV
ncbi:MAG: hypothetical protein LBG21_07055 [Campylobacteraceae bacterium]|jgi:hypothetical protein|nr:hypothetical protein [Campylobacteraceae bacterium]